MADKCSVICWVKPEDETGSVIRHQNQLRRRDTVPYSDRVTQTPSQQRVRGEGTSVSCNTRYDCTRDAAVSDVIFDVITGSAIEATTSSTSAEGQPSRDTADPSDPEANLLTQMESECSEADQPAATNSLAADVDTPARPT